MNHFSEELRKEREAKNITLAEIAHQTRINIKYLQAIDQGAFDILPQTYVRAFIKAYAEAIGMDASQILKVYDIHSTPEHRQENASVRDEAKLNYRTASTDNELKKEKQNRSMIVLAGLAVATLLIALFLYNYFTEVVPANNVKETSFQEVVKEQEKAKPVPVAVDSVDTVKTAKQNLPKPDSLVLRIVASDSVWISISHDSLPIRSGYMLRGRYRTYTAKKEFNISVSDGGAVRFLLNGKEIQPLGSKGKRVKNARITAEQLQ
ncbi:MAG: RodZ domain-containing protein [Bacteroidota bacterium]